LNANADREPEDDEEESNGVSPLLTAKSYAAFVVRATKARPFLFGGALAFGLLLTVLTVMYYPRRFSCTTVLMGQGSMVLEGSGAGAPAFPGAETLVGRRENLEAITRELGLVKKWRDRRPPLLKLKDQLFEKAFGRLDDETMVSVIVGTLQGKLWVKSDWSTMTVSVDWTDGKTAAEIAEAARESYVKSRYATDMSAFEEKMKILESHSTKLREEIEMIAGQISSKRDEQLAQARAAASSSAVASSAGAPRVEFRRRLPTVPDERKAALRAELAEKKRRLADSEAERERSVRSERAKIDDMKLRLTESHPEVIRAEQRVAMMAQAPSELLLLKSEIESMQSEIAQLDAVEKNGALGGAGSVRAERPAQSEPLPSEIIGLLNKDDADPILVAQLSGAVSKYGALRDGLRSGRIELDTAQAAFHRRYKLIVPAEPPSRPYKPNVLAIFGGGLAVSLLLALLFPVILELRRGIIVERWQVDHVRLPVLAELRLPPRSSE
jgi:uncharacterized protein involved in exopolysaccharide biosynthesis